MVSTTNYAWISMARDAHTLHLGDWSRVRECSEELMAEFARGVDDNRFPAHTEGIVARFVCWGWRMLCSDSTKMAPYSNKC
jgi:hypothetical protein